MIEISDGVYTCSLCGAKVTVSDFDELPWANIVTDGGKPAERVITVGAVELHRCPYDGPLHQK